jgi:hypothetical protein
VIFLISTLFLRGSKLFMPMGCIIFSFRALRASSSQWFLLWPICCICFFFLALGSIVCLSEIAYVLTLLVRLLACLLYSVYDTPSTWLALARGSRGGKSRTQYSSQSRSHDCLDTFEVQSGVSSIVNGFVSFSPDKSDFERFVALGRREYGQVDEHPS